MAKIRDVIDCGQTIKRPDASVKISKLMQEVRQSVGLVQARDLKLETMSGLVEKASGLREELVKVRVDKDRLTAAIKVVLALGIVITKLKTTTGSPMSSLREKTARAVEAERGPTRVHEVVAVSDSHQTTLGEKVSSLTEELLSIPVKCTNLKADSDEIMALEQWMKDNVGKLLSNVCTVV